MGNAVSLPEFFYPNDTYQYTSSHDVVPGKVIFRFQHSKLSYRLCSELACLVAQQVEDFRQCTVPTKYGEKDISILAISHGTPRVWLKLPK